MPSKYVDVSAIMQVIGCVYNNPQLLDLTDKYSIVDEDFPDQFHKIVFGAIFKLHELGAQKITLSSIADFLSSRPKSEAIYKQQKGEEWLLKVSENCIANTFDYYYNRLKKFSLLRAYDNYGINITDIYDPDNIIDIKKKQLQEDRLDNRVYCFYPFYCFYHFYFPFSSCWRRRAFSCSNCCRRVRRASISR